MARRQFRQRYSDAPQFDATLVVDPWELWMWLVEAEDHTTACEELRHLWSNAVRGNVEAAAGMRFVLSVNVSREARQSISPGTRAAVLDGALCVACGVGDDLEVDHIVPWSRGGSNERDNLQPLCGPCNRAKGARTMDEWRPDA